MKILIPSQQWLSSLVLVWLQLVSVAAMAQSSGRPQAASPEDRAVIELRRALKEEPQWVKVHAAEALLASNHREEVQSVFEQELKRAGNEPQYRTGIWRVLAKADPDKARRTSYINNLVSVAVAENSLDRVHAVEALAKLRYELTATEKTKVEKFAESSPAADESNYRWLLANSAKAADVDALVDLLKSPTAEPRSGAAYGLRFLAVAKPLPQQAIDQLTQVATKEPASAGRVYLISAAYVVAKEPQSLEFHQKLMSYLKSDVKEERYEALCALAIRGNKDDLSHAIHLLDDHEADVRVAAAAAILQISHRLAQVN